MPEFRLYVMAGGGDVVDLADLRGLSKAEAFVAAARLARKGGHVDAVTDGRVVAPGPASFADG